MSKNLVTTFQFAVVGDRVAPNGRKATSDKRLEALRARLEQVLNESDVLGHVTLTFRQDERGDFGY